MTKKTPVSAKSEAPAKKGEESYRTILTALADIVTERGLSSIEYESLEMRFKVTRGPAEGTAAPVVYSAPAAAPAPAAAAAPIAAAPAAQDFSMHPGAVKSPMVGVIYLSPEPSAPAYVKVGDAVTAGQTLFLVEAMKTFNPVKSPRSGKVVQVLVANGDPVEYDEPLLILE